MPGGILSLGFVRDAGRYKYVHMTTKQGAAAEAFREARDLLLRHRTDYAAARREFGWPELSQFNWALDWFDALAAEHPDRLALWIVTEDGADVRLSYAAMRTRSDQVANWLRGLGVRRADHVLLMLGNQVPLWEVILAAMKLGALIIPATTLLRPDDLADRITRGAVRHVVTESGQTAKFAGLAAAAETGDWTPIAVGPPVAGWHSYGQSHEAPTAFAPDGVTKAADPLLLYFTSGTTARPKLVEHTHASYPVGHLSTMYWLGLQPGDVHLNISSPGWAKHAWSNVFAPWIAGATALILGHERFSAATLLDAIPACGVTSLCAPPTVWRMLVQADLAGADVRSLRECVGAGEPLNPEVIEQVRRGWNITIRDGYGQTETTAQIGNSPGQPVGLMTGYRGDAERAAEAMRGGYYHTGDVAARDSGGYITYIGRTDDLFKASDYRISPFELESVLIEHEAVAEAAVVPSPDPLRLAVPKAYVMLAAGFDPSAETAFAILAYARERLAPYKRIRRLEFAELPKTISGKIRRVELRGQEDDRHRAGDGGPASAAGPRPSRTAAEFWEEDFPDLKAVSPDQSD